MPRPALGALDVIEGFPTRNKLAVAGKVRFSVTQPNC